MDGDPLGCDLNPCVGAIGASVDVTTNRASAATAATGSDSITNSGRKDTAVRLKANRGLLHSDRHHVGHHLDRFHVRGARASRCVLVYRAFAIHQDSA